MFETSCCEDDAGTAGTGSAMAAGETFGDGAGCGEDADGTPAAFGGAEATVAATTRRGAVSPLCRRALCCMHMDGPLPSSPPAAPDKAAAH